jgi:uncharacterized repeat protein (TIGR03803 family)
MVRVIVGCAIVVFVAACSAASGPSSVPAVNSAGAAIDAPAGHFRLLHAFANSPDGADPNGTLVQLNGTLFGVTDSGGTKGNYGTIYSLSITGKEKVLYSFDYYDGYAPEGGLLAYNGLLYGTVAVASNYYGEVYSITPSGSFTVLHKFMGVDGLNPAAGLMETGGTLYGTTYQGGTREQGNVYSITPKGSETSIYSFGTYSGDGTYPSCKLTFWKNKLWGTTNGGGTYNDGTVFSLTKSGKETILHSFGNGTDGKSPYSSNLTPLDGVLYGTTYAGGTHGEGTVFEVLPSGVVKTLYNFGDIGNDGDYPDAGVIAYRGSLYGTTTYAGANNQGTIFRVTTGGKETILYSFSGNDGSDSYARLLPEGSNMYATLHDGGANNAGTAFRFTP